MICENCWNGPSAEGCLHAYDGSGETMSTMHLWPFSPPDGRCDFFMDRSGPPPSYGGIIKIRRELWEGSQKNSAPACNSAKQETPQATE